MQINTSNNLSKEKKKIAFLFTISIFFIVIFLEMSFLVFKYIDYQRSEIWRLDVQGEMLSKSIKENPNFENAILNWNDIFWNITRPQIPFWENWPDLNNKSRKIRIQNFFIYNNISGEIVFSPIIDDELYESILNTIAQSKNSSFIYNSQEYFFTNKRINNKLSILLFVESRVSLNNILIDLSEYLFFAILLSILIYYISLKFVSRTLKPVEENISNMEQFIHNAGHELKTPISVIKSYLQLAKLKKNYDEASQESIIELDKMNNLIQALISLSTLKWDTEKSKVNLNISIKNIVKTFEEAIEEKHLKIEIIENTVLELEINQEYFNIFFTNFFTNAIKYNKPLGKIIITIDKNSLEIKDTWKWINGENISKIFDRFYQESEWREENSSGIGLSIVKKIADIYNWKIEVTSHKWAETKFLIKF